jgi:solute:Na+ symporter, SSS family
MAPLDWLAVGVYLAIGLFIGLYFVRRASGSMEDYFIAGRSLPWWVIGLANCATYTGGSAAWVMLVFQDGLVGNYWWWPSWVIWMPVVAVLWARYWRRMGIVTTAEFIELRYSGRMAKAYRVVYALYNCFGWAPLVTGYMTGWMVVELQPILGWTRFEIILACGIVVLFYTVVSGLFGVVYNQVFQFSLYLVGAALLIPFMLSYFGGWHNAVSAAVAVRGPAFMNPLPPSASITPLILLALFVQGFFFAANPTAGEGSTAQRFMAARDETHAALGQVFSAFLALVLRLIPFIIYGIVAAALFSKTSVAPELVWSRLVLKFAPHGLRGVLIAAELAGYMAIANAYMNWGGSFLTNDIYKRLINPRSSDRRLAWVGKLATVAIVTLSFLVALFLVNRMMSWFLYINAVMIAFILPLAWLRFFWWRLNIWGEAAGVLLGLPLGYLIWFPLGFSTRPFWLAFFVLFGAGWAVILLVTWATQPESIGTLRRFYECCKPPGLWGPVASTYPPETSKRIEREFRGDLVSCSVGIVLFGSMVVLLNSAVAGHWQLTAGAVAAALLSGAMFIRRWRASPPVETPATPATGAAGQKR